MARGFTTSVVWVAVWGASRKVYVFRLKRDAEAFMEREQGRGNHCTVERTSLTEAVPHLLDEDHEWMQVNNAEDGVFEYACWCGQRKSWRPSR